MIHWNLRRILKKNIRYWKSLFNVRHCNAIILKMMFLKQIFDLCWQWIQLILKAPVFCRNELWFHFMPRLQSESQMQLNLCSIYREAIIRQMSVCALSTFWARQTALTSSTISSSSLSVDPTNIFLTIKRQSHIFDKFDFVTNVKD